MPDPNDPPLSSAAQAVMDAYGHEVGGIAALISYERRGIAAALRAAADQVVPDGGAFLSPGTAGQIRSALLAIAAELEGHV